ncbi:MAG TPA: hypothetical protein VFK02_00600 [Kofleriaceae bacterium]|nr:hypothetical protein [Kofleriaceae bacterium]
MTQRISSSHAPRSTPKRSRLARSSIAGAILVALGAGVAWAGGDWSAARSKAEEFDHKADELTRRAPVEARKIVTAICAATDDARKDAADRASRDAESAINDKYRELERVERDAVDALDQVTRDDGLKDKHSEARSRRSEIKSRWDKLGDQTRSLRDGRHPVVELMLRGGESARRDRLDRCDAKDVRLGFEHAACLKVQGDTCVVIELAADNSSAISKSRDRARAVKSRLEEEIKKGFESDVMKQLVDHKREFAKCKRVESRIDCFKQCPEISDDNRVREVSPSWRENC